MLTNNWRSFRNNWRRGDFTPYAIVLVPRSTWVLNEGALLVLDNLSGCGRYSYHPCQNDESAERYLHIGQHNHLRGKQM